MVAKQVPVTALRILVLTSSTGGGHDARAYAFRDWVMEVHGEAVEVRVEHLLEASSALTGFGVWLYNRIQKHAPWLHNFYWCFIEIYGALTQHLPWFGDRYYKNLLLDYRPHLVFSVHDFLNRGYFETARKTLDPDKVRLATYCGEFSGGFGYSRNWVDSQADLFYARTGEARDYAVGIGIPEQRCRVFGNLLAPKFFEEKMAEEERDRFCAQELGLDTGKFTILLATGAKGANNHLRLLDTLKEYSQETQAIVICGKDRKTHAKIAAWKSLNPDFSLHLEGFSSRMHRLLQVSQAVVTRGGSNLTAEALFCGCPILFDCTGGIMPQERLTINYFVSHKAAERISSPQQFAALIKRWSEQPKEYSDLKNNLEALRPADHPRQLVDALVELAREAAGADPSE